MTLHERLQQIGNFISNLFSKVPVEIKAYAKEAHKITTAIADALGSDMGKVITSIIPGDWDEKLRVEAILLLGDLSNILAKIEGDDEAPKAARNALLAKMASKLIAIQDGNDLPENRYDLYQQINYSAAIKKVA